MNNEKENEKDQANNLIKNVASKSDSKKTLNFRVNTIQLNYIFQKFLINENTLTDVLKFKHWDQNLEIPEKQTLVKDLTRTRNDDVFFKKQSVQKDLQLLATFYCQQNNVNYQQGMLEIVIPFRLMKSNDIPLEKCYAYFNTFMNEYFPKVLEQRVIGESKELAHALSAIHFCEILIKYHLTELYQKLSNVPEFNLSMVVPQWIMTLFAKNTPIELTFLIFHKYMKRKNQNYIFYLSCAIFQMKSQEIYEILRTDPDQLLPYMNKKLKNFKDENDIVQLFKIADGMASQTPNSFDLLISQTSFHEHTIQSVEEVKELINIKDNVLYSKVLYLFCSDLFEMLSASSLAITANNTKNIEIKLLDTRDSRKIKLHNFVNKKSIITSKQKDFSSTEEVQKNIQKIQMKILAKLLCSKQNTNIHICLIGNHASENTLKFAQIFKQNSRSYVSLLMGGFEVNIYLHLNIKELQKYCQRNGYGKKIDNPCYLM